MSKTLKFENFDPLSIMLIGKKVKGKFFDLEMPSRRQENEDSNLPHQDLIDAIKAFGSDMAPALSMTQGWDFAVTEIRENLDATKSARDAQNAAELACDVRGISWHGEKRMSIQLKGSVTYPDGTQSQTTPHISLDPEKNPRAKDLLLKVDELKKEFWAYQFKGKFTVSEKKKKADADAKATEAFEKAIDNDGKFE